MVTALFVVYVVEPMLAVWDAVECVARGLVKESRAVAGDTP